MYNWTLSNVDLSGNDKEDIRRLKQKIDEINQAMRVLVTQMRKESNNGKNSIG